MGATDMFYRLFWCFSGATSTSASQSTGSQHHSLVVATPSGPTSCWLGFLSGSSNQRGTTTRIGNDTAEIPSNPGTSTRLSSQIFINSIAKMFWRFLTKKLRLEIDSKTVQRSALCRSRRELSNEYLLAKIGVDIAENEPLEVWGKLFNIIQSFP